MTFCQTLSNILVTFLYRHSMVRQRIMFFRNRNERIFSRNRNGYISFKNKRNTRNDTRYQKIYIENFIINFHISEMLKNIISKLPKIKDMQSLKIFRNIPKTFPKVEDLIQKDFLSRLKVGESLCIFINIFSNNSPICPCCP